LRTATTGILFSLLQLTEDFPSATIHYLGCGRMLKFTHRKWEKVNSSVLYSRNEDCLSLFDRVGDELFKRKEPKILTHDVFADFDATHVCDIFGHLNAEGTNLLANKLVFLF